VEKEFSPFIHVHESKQTDLLTPNGVRETGGSQLVATGKTDAINCVSPNVSRVRGEQIRVL